MNNLNGNRKNEFRRKQEEKQRKLALKIKDEAGELREGSLKSEEAIPSLDELCAMGERVEQQTTFSAKEAIRNKIKARRDAERYKTTSTDSEKWTPNPFEDSNAAAIESPKNEDILNTTRKHADAGIKNDEKGTKALFFISQAQIKALATLAVADDIEDKKAYKEALQKALRKNPSVDIALFGRMVADDPSLNFDAAAQVAHSISTHAVQNEYDYFTAVDDCQAEDNAGAGHLGTVEYNSATLYRYATVNVMELERHLGAKKAAEVVRSFGEAFIRSMPTGKQNTFANRTLPDAVYVTIREDQPVNLCGAFERAVRKSVEGYAEPSKSALQAYAQQLYQSFAEAPAKSFTVGTGLEALAPAQPLNTMLDALEEAVKENLTGNEVE